MRVKEMRMKAISSVTMSHLGAETNAVSTCLHRSGDLTRILALDPDLLAQTIVANHFNHLRFPVAGGDGTGKEEQLTAVSNTST